MNSPPGPALRLCGVSKTFGADTSEPTIALAAVDLEVCAGQLLVVVGSNGAGKTTLLNVIAGVVEVDAGSIVVDGADVTKLSARVRARFIGRVSQDPAAGTAGYLTVAENLCLARRRGSRRGLRWGVTSSLRAEATQRLAEVRVGVEGRLNAQAGSLSGGQRQALAMVMATWNRPKILLLDEHTSALDPRAAAKVMLFTSRIPSTDGTAVVMVTHNLSLAVGTAHRLIVMHRGQIIRRLDEGELVGMTVKDLVDIFTSAGAEPPAKALAGGAEGAPQ